LAGHSFGGLYSLSFRRQFPDQVVGLVLLDSTAPGRAPTDASQNHTGGVTGRVAALLPGIGQLGAGRDLGSSLQGYSRDPNRCSKRPH
jgi:pimeloyl-ACP methyl ester carboxylesterase